MACSILRFPSKLKGLRHDAHGEDTGLAGYIRNGRRRAGAGAASHAGGDEHHVGVLKALGYIVAALLGAPFFDLRIGTGSLSVRELFADLNLLIRIGNGQRLLSVLIAINSTPFVPELTIRFTTLFPAPPTPTTLIVTTFSGPVSFAGKDILLASQLFYYAGFI
jgi:hypothetical protein